MNPLKPLLRQRLADESGVHLACPSDHLVLDVGRDHRNRHRRMAGADLRSQFEPILLRHVEVDHGQVDLPLAQDRRGPPGHCRPRLCPIRAGARPESWLRRCGQACCRRRSEQLSPLRYSARDRSARNDRIGLEEKGYKPLLVYAGRMTTLQPPCGPGVDGGLLRSKPGQSSPGGRHPRLFPGGSAAGPSGPEEPRREDARHPSGRRCGPCPA